MRRETLPLLRPVLGWGLTEGLLELGLCRGLGQELPGALTVQRPLGLPLLARGPQQAATRLAQVAFQLVIGPRQPRHPRRH